MKPASLTQAFLATPVAAAALLGCALFCGCVDSGAASSGPPFELSLQPTSLRIVRGQAAPLNAQILSANTYDGPATFTLNGAPAGVAIVPASVDALPGEVLWLSVRTTAQTPLGQFELQVTATFLESLSPDAPSASAALTLEVVPEDTAAPPDAGPIDAGSSDAGSSDAGSDAGITDAGPSDAGITDGGEDAGEGFDASVPLPPDAGVSANCPVQVSSGSAAVAVQIDAAHTGAQPNDALTIPLCQRWVRTLPNPLVTTPMVSRGRVFITLGGDLYALNEANGDTLWGPVAVDEQNGLTSPVLDQGRVYVVGGSGLAQAYDQVTGAHLWSTQLSGVDFYTGDGDPVAYDGRLFVEGDGDGVGFYALDGASGRLLWSAFSDGLNAGPAADAAGVYMQLGCGPVYAYTADGLARWMAAPPCYGSTGDSLGTIYQGRFYTGDSQPAGILDLATGAQLGTFSTQFTQAFVGDQMITSSTSQLVALHLPDLTPVWSVNNNIGYNWGPALPIGGNIVDTESAFTFGRVVVLDGSSGAMLDSSDISNLFITSDGQIWGTWSQTAADGMYFLSVGTSLVAY